MHYSLSVWWEFVLVISFVNDVCKWESMRRLFLCFAEHCEQNSFFFVFLFRKIQNYRNEKRMVKNNREREPEREGGEIETLVMNEMSMCLLSFELRMFVRLSKLFLSLSLSTLITPEIWWFADKYKVCLNACNSWKQISCTGSICWATIEWVFPEVSFFFSLVSLS